MSLDAVKGASCIAFDRKVARAVSRSLHDAAQPLTVLHGLLELMLQAKPESDYKGKVVHAIEQLRRVSNCFDHLRRLIRLQEPAEDVVDVTASSLVQEVLRELQSSFATSGVKCLTDARRAKADGDLAEPLIKVSRSRTTLAFRLALTNLLSRLQSGDSLSVSIEAAPEQVAVRIQPGPNWQALPGTPDRTDSDAMNARLDLAHTLVVSTGGEMRSTDARLSIDIVLPRSASLPAGTNPEGTRSTHV